MSYANYHVHFYIQDTDNDSTLVPITANEHAALTMAEKIVEVSRKRYTNDIFVIVKMKQC